MNILCEFMFDCFILGVELLSIMLIAWVLVIVGEVYK